MNSLKVLVVDDDSGDRKLIRRLISKINAEVEIREASSISDMSRVGDTDIDAIFMDYRLPDGDGLEMIKPALERWPRCAVILITGQGDEKIAKTAIMLGAMDYVSKSSLSANVAERMLENGVKAARLRWTLQERYSELEVFSDTLVHDLKAPIRSINFFADQIEEDLDGGDIESALESVRYVRKATQQMGNLITCIADHVKHDREVLVGVASISSIIDQVKTTLCDAISESEAQVDYVGPEISLSCIQPQISQLFQNLIANSIKYSGAEKPQIRVLAERASGRTHVKVIDNGIGVPDEYRTRIFEPFKRINRPDRPRGTGLGLATCRKIVDRHSGSIWCEPGSPQGTVFHVILGEVAAWARNEQLEEPRDDPSCELAPDSYRQVGTTILEPSSAADHKA